jgi:UDP-3-O-[3-hydroxymyristoyl] N-acetylglucosamine deacetylase/3-hydroxyacyl-[acyl-carrier-protein] dehydratase
MEKQKTIEKPVSFSGHGLHTGNLTTVVFKPAPPNTGIVFARTDLPNKPTIKADIDHVVDVRRGTTLGANGARVLTVEHVLAAISGLEIDNVFVELDANEPPVGDGSSLPFVETLLEGDIIEQEAPREYIEIEEAITFRDKDRIITVLPWNELRLSVTADYAHRAIGTQYRSISVRQEEFAQEIASARTFCFLHEVEALKAQGLIKGGSLENAVVIGTESILNENLRFPDEFVRHLILDLLGDLTLLGRPLKGHVIAIKPGHTPNARLAQKIRRLTVGNQYYSPAESQTLRTVKKGRSLNINQIKRILPHRYPFLLVDKVVSLVEGERVVGIKNVTANEPYFAGHWPDHPVMPGVLVLEVMAQVAGLLMLSKAEPGQLAYFAGIDKAKFRRPVCPGDQLLVEVDAIKIKSKSSKMHGKVTVDGALAAEAELLFTIFTPSQSGLDS